VGFRQSFWKFWEPGKSFDWDKFEKAKIAFAQSRPNLNSLVTEEEKAAFLESATGFAPTPGTIKAYRKLLLLPLLKQQHDGNLKPLGRAKLENALAAYYVSIHGAPDSIVKGILEGREAALKRWILARVELSIAKDGAEKAFSESGILAADGWREAYHDYVNTAVSPLFDAVMSLPLVAGHLPVLLPKQLYLRGIKLPPQVLEKIEKTGVDSAYPKLKELARQQSEIYGDPANFDLYWSMFHKLAVGGLAAWYELKVLDKIWNQGAEQWNEYEQTEKEKVDHQNQVNAINKQTLIERGQSLN
jgi:hypothetical protein